MDYTLTIDAHDGYLHAVVEGTYGLPAIERFLTEIYDACVERRMSAVLVEDRLVGPSLDVYEIFDVIVKYTVKAFTLRIRFAYVDAGNNRNATVKQFAEQMSHIKGVNLKIFPTVNDAVAWLTGNPSNAGSSEQP